MNVLEKIRKAQSTVYLFFFTILVIPFQVLLLGFPLVQSLYSPTATVNFGSDTYPYLVGYFALTIFYCIALSLAFNPKRIISPINVQIGASVIVSVLLIFWEMTHVAIYTLPQALSLLLALGLLVSLSTFFLVAIGFIQYIIVSWVVGLTFENIDRTSYVINAKTDEVMKVLGDEFLDVWSFSRKKDNPKAKKEVIWVLKCRDTAGSRIVLTIGSHYPDKDKCVLATVAYHSTLYNIKTSDSASGMRKSIVNDIEKRLSESNPQFTITKTDVIDDPCSCKAYSQALAVTYPKTELTKEFFSNIPHYYKYGIIITVLALALMAVAFIINSIDRGTFVGAVVVLLVALVAEFGVSLREELSRQQIEELD